MAYTDEVKGRGSGNWVGIDGEVGENLPWADGEPGSIEGLFDCSALRTSVSQQSGLTALMADHCLNPNAHACIRRKYHHKKSIKI